MKSLPSWRVSKKSDFRRSKIFFLNSNSGFLDDLRCQYQSSQEESLYRSSPRARSPIAKKIWFPIHPRNFDSYVTVRPPTRPPARLSAPQENQCEMWHFLASVGACNHDITHPCCSQNMVSLTTVSRAQLSNHRGHVFFLFFYLTADKFLVFNWSQL